MKDKVLLIITNYNKEKYIETCLDSAINQKIDTNQIDYDIYIVDDWSTDHSPEIITNKVIDHNSYPLFEGKIYKKINLKNIGISECCNNAINYARGENYNYISFLDGDDTIEPTYIQDLYNAVKRFNVKAALCHYKDNSKTDNLWGETYLTNPDIFYFENRINLNVRWGKLYDVSLFNNIRYPKGRIHEDIATTYKLLFPLKVIAIVNKKLYNYEKHEDSLTLNKNIWNMGHLSMKDYYFDQAMYFKDNNFPKSYELAINYYMSWLSTSITDEENGPSNDVKKLLKKELTDALYWYVDDLYKSNNINDTYSALRILKATEPSVYKKKIKEENDGYNTVAYDYLKYKYSKKLVAVLRKRNSKYDPKIRKELREFRQDIKDELFGAIKDTYF